MLRALILFVLCSSCVLVPGSTDCSLHNDNRPGIVSIDRGSAYCSDYGLIRLNDLRVQTRYRVRYRVRSLLTTVEYMSRIQYLITYNAYNQK